MLRACKQVRMPFFGGYKTVDDGRHDIAHTKPFCTSAASFKGRIIPEAMTVHSMEQSYKESPNHVIIKVQVSSTVPLIFTRPFCFAIKY
jgi:hypothetical protein